MWGPCTSHSEAACFLGRLHAPPSSVSSLDRVMSPRSHAATQVHAPHPFSANVTLCRTRTVILPDTRMLWLRCGLYLL